jgi:hypothetical protein
MVKIESHLMSGHTGSCVYSEQKQNQLLLSRLLYSLDNYNTTDLLFVIH